MVTDDICSIGSGEDSGEDEVPKPVKKKQISLQDFFAKNKEKDGEQKPPTPSKVAAMKPKPKAAPAKKAPAKVVVSEDLDEDDAYLKPPSKAKTSKKPPAPKKSKKELSDDDGSNSDMEVDFAAPKRVEAPRRAARAAPKKYIELSSGGEDESDD